MEPIRPRNKTRAKGVTQKNIWKGDSVVAKHYFEGKKIRGTAISNAKYDRETGTWRVEVKWVDGTHGWMDWVEDGRAHWRVGDGGGPGTYPYN